MTLECIYSELIYFSHVYRKRSVIHKLYNNICLIYIFKYTSYY